LGPTSSYHRDVEIPQAVREENRIRLRAAFTLLEVMAVVLILGFVFLVMGNVYRATVGPAATSPSQTEVTRRGLLLIDRVARDLEGATLVGKPKDVDPLAHPWLFYADSRRGMDGSDRLKFDSRSVTTNAEHGTTSASFAGLRLRCPNRSTGTSPAAATMARRFSPAGSRALACASSMAMASELRAGIRPRWSARANSRRRRRSPWR
jgi:hypothetical protein